MLTQHIKVHTEKFACKHLSLRDFSSLLSCILVGLCGHIWSGELFALLTLNLMGAGDLNPPPLDNWDDSDLELHCSVELIYDLYREGRLQ